MKLYKVSWTERSGTADPVTGERELKFGKDIFPWKTADRAKRAVQLARPSCTVMAVEVLDEMR